MLYGRTRVSFRMKDVIFASLGLTAGMPDVFSCAGWGVLKDEVGRKHDRIKTMVDLTADTLSAANIQANACGNVPALAKVLPTELLLVCPCRLLFWGAAVGSTGVGAGSGAALFPSPPAHVVLNWGTSTCQSPRTPLRATCDCCSGHTVPLHVMPDPTTSIPSHVSGNSVVFDLFCLR